MALCPRCALCVPAYTRCDRCGLMLGFEGLTVLIDFEDSPLFERVRRLARQASCCEEWKEENGHRFLRVTYAVSELQRFRPLAKLAGGLGRRHAFYNGLEVGWEEFANAIRERRKPSWLALDRSHPDRSSATVN